MHFDALRKMPYFVPSQEMVNQVRLHALVCVIGIVRMLLSWRLNQLRALFGYERLLRLVI